MTLSFQPRDEPDLDNVWLWFNFQLELIAQERSRVLASIPSGLPLHVHPRYLGMTREDVKELFDQQRGELELLTMFELLATVEALLRLDFKTRVAKRKKDDLSRRFRQIYKKAGEKIQLDEHILTPLKECGVAVGDMRGALRLRHWLAHGRHWHPKLGRGYTPNDILDIARALTAALPD